MVLLRLLGEVSATDHLRVRIGQENSDSGLTNASVVSTGYGVDGRVLAQLGVVGPTRMDYQSSMSAVHLVARYLRRVVTGTAEEESHSGLLRVLGVPRDATGEEIKRSLSQARPRAAPRCQPGSAHAGAVQGVTAAYEVLSDPEAADVRPRRRPRGGAGPGFGGAGGFDFGDIMDAFFGGGGSQAQQGPRPRVRRGQDALIQVDLDLDEAAFGTVRTSASTRPSAARPAAVTGVPPGTEPAQCTMCHGRGHVQSVQRSFLGQVADVAGLPPVPWLRHAHHTSVPGCNGDGRVRTRRTVSVKIPAGIPGPTPASGCLAGRGGPGAGPRATSTSGARAATRCSRGAATTST